MEKNSEEKFKGKNQRKNLMNKNFSMIGVDAERLSQNGFEMPGQNFTEKKENIVNEYANQDSILFLSYAL